MASKFNSQLHFSIFLLLATLLLSSTSFCFPALPPGLSRQSKEWPSGLKSTSVAKLIDFFTSVFSGSKKDKKGDGHGGKGEYLEAISGRATSTFILLHGLGDDAKRYSTSLRLVRATLPNTRFIFPQADVQNVTYRKESTASWFDITRKDGDEFIVDKAGLLKAVARLDKIVEGEIRSGIAKGKVFIGGLSQGGAVALTACLRSEVELAGCVGVSTWLPLRSDYPKDAKDGARDAKVLLIHGMKDDAVKFGLAEKTKDTFEKLKRNVKLVPIEGEGHLLPGARLKVGSMIIDFIRDNA